jgi:hypothetical protein
MAYLIGFYLVTGAVIALAHEEGKNYSTPQRIAGFLMITLLWLPCLIARKAV